MRRGGYFAAGVADRRRHLGHALTIDGCGRFLDTLARSATRRTKLRARGHAPKSITTEPEAKAAAGPTAAPHSREGVISEQTSAPLPPSHTPHPAACRAEERIVIKTSERIAATEEFVEDVRGAAELEAHARTPG